MAEAFIVRRGGGGGSGGTLVVTSSGAGTVTVSNSVLGKSYSKSVTAGGSVTFKGLKTGEWTVTLSNEEQTSTRSITINADYSVSIAYFSATISVTYPANSTCVVTNSGGQTVASDANTGSSTKTWTVTVNATDTYTVTATDGTDTESMAVSITHEGQAESVELDYNFYLYKSGDQMNEVTGGWKSHYSNGDGASFDSDKISLWGKALTYTGAVQTVKKIDFSKFRELSVICVDPTTGIVVRLSTHKTTESFRDENIASASSEVPGATSIDLSKINSSGYVALYSDGKATVTEVYLK